MKYTWDETNIIWCSFGFEGIADFGPESLEKKKKSCEVQVIKVLLMVLCPRIVASYFTFFYRRKSHPKEWYSFHVFFVKLALAYYRFNGLYTNLYILYNLMRTDEADDEKTTPI